MLLTLPSPAPEGTGYKKLIKGHSTVRHTWNEGVKVIYIESGKNHISFAGKQT
jgi:hypothetical protein